MGLTVNAPILPSGLDSALVLHLRKPTLYEWRCIEEEVLASLGLQPAISIITVVEWNVLSKGGRV
jgi:hypothetical protein